MIECPHCHKTFARSKMPKQKPGQSKQDYGTPWDLIRAVEARFGSVVVDLAAEEHNKKCDAYISPEQNSLVVPWAEAIVDSDFETGTGGASGIAWLNPPFGKITPWAAKCALEAKKGLGLKIAFLVPASVGSNWYRNHVVDNAYVCFLNPRVTFEGEEHPFPKDVMVAMFGYTPGSEVWQWKQPSRAVKG